MKTQDSIFRARENLSYALITLPKEEEYLREALEEQVHGLDVLLDKVNVEEALLRDRKVLLSDPSVGLGEHIDADVGSSRCDDQDEDG
jgi:hypothetical protein